MRLQPQDGGAAAAASGELGETFCGKLLCSADGARYTVCAMQCTMQCTMECTMQCTM